MNDPVYIKDGRSRRLEIEGGRIHDLTIQERGQAIERKGTFECETLDGQSAVEPSEVIPIPAELVELLEGRHDELERATVITGAAHHELRREGKQLVWRDQGVRLHVSITSGRNRLRCELDRGGRGFRSGWIEELTEIRETMASCEADRRVSGPICLEPPVSAALLALIWTRNRGAGLGLSQVPRVDEIDGYGTRVSECRIDPGSDHDTWFRPSYRVPPRAIPHGLDLAAGPGGSEIPQNRAIALAGAPESSGNLFRMPCLVRDDHGAAVTWVEIDLERWDEQIAVSSGREEWFPFLAGVWGRRLVRRGEG